MNQAGESARAPTVADRKGRKGGGMLWSEPGAEGRAFPTHQRSGEEPTERANNPRDRANSEKARNFGRMPAAKKLSEAGLVYASTSRTVLDVRARLPGFQVQYRGAPYETPQAPGISLARRNRAQVLGSYSDAVATA